MSDLDQVIQVLLNRSAHAVLRGAELAHHETYRDVVRQVGASPLTFDLVVEMRHLYAESEQAQRDGAERQPTYRRGLVDVLAARLSEEASNEAGRQVVISPAKARPVLDGHPASGAIFTTGSWAEPGDVIAAAVAGRQDDDEG